MSKLTTFVIAAAFAVATLVPGIAAACMKSSVTAQSVPTTLVDGAGTTTVPPMTPAPGTKTGG